MPLKKNMKNGNTFAGLDPDTDIVRYKTTVHEINEHLTVTVDHYTSSFSLDLLHPGLSEELWTNAPQESERHHRDAGEPL